MVIWKLFPATLTSECLGASDVLEGSKEKIKSNIELPQQVVANNPAAPYATHSISIELGFLISRLTVDKDPTSSTAAVAIADADDKEDVIGGSNHVAAWADDASASFKIGDAGLAASRVLA